MDKMNSCSLTAVETRSPVEEVYENQRFYVGFGWAAPLKVLDWPNWSNATGDPVVLEPTPQEGPAWELVYGPHTDHEGWIYGTAFGRLQQPRVGGRACKRATDVARTRLWVRRGTAGQAGVAAQAMRSKDPSRVRSHRQHFGRRAATQAHAVAFREAWSALLDVLKEAARRRQVPDLALMDAGAMLTIMSQHGKMMQRQQVLQLQRNVLKPEHVVLQISPEAHTDSPRSTNQISSSIPSQGLLPSITRSTLQELLCCVEHARAAYGYVMLQGHLSSIQRFAAMQVQAPYFDVIGGASFEAHTEALQEMLGISEEDILLAEWSSAVCRPCHFVVVSRKHRCIVLAIRGSLQWGDVCTDVTAAAVNLELDGVLGKVHEGMLSAAAYVHSNIIEVLHEAANVYQGWPLLVTGHSLGAGVASVLAVLLQQPGAKPAGVGPVRCYPIAPPSVMTSELANRSSEFIVSLVVGSDVVPRLSLHSLEKLLLEIKRASWVTRVMSSWTSALSSQRSAPTDASSAAAEAAGAVPAKPSSGLQRSPSQADGLTSLLESTPSDMNSAQQIAADAVYSMDHPSSSVDKSTDAALTAVHSADRTLDAAPTVTHSLGQVTRGTDAGSKSFSPGSPPAGVLPSAAGPRDPSRTDADSLSQQLSYPAATSAADVPSSCRNLSARVATGPNLVAKPVVPQIVSSPHKSVPSICQAAPSAHPSHPSVHTSLLPVDDSRPSTLTAAPLVHDSAPSAQALRQSALEATFSSAEDSDSDDSDADLDFDEWIHLTDKEWLMQSLGQVTNPKRTRGGHSGSKGGAALLAYSGKPAPHVGKGPLSRFDMHEERADSHTREGPSQQSSVREGPADSPSVHHPSVWEWPSHHPSVNAMPADACTDEGPSQHPVVQKGLVDLRTGAGPAQGALQGSGSAEGDSPATNAGPANGRDTGPNRLLAGWSNFFESRGLPMWGADRAVKQSSSVHIAAGQSATAAATTTATAMAPAGPVSASATSTVAVIAGATDGETTHAVTGSNPNTSSPSTVLPAAAADFAISAAPLRPAGPLTRDMGEGSEGWAWVRSPATGDEIGSFGCSNAWSEPGAREGSQAQVPCAVAKASGDQPAHTMSHASADACMARIGPVPNTESVVGTRDESTVRTGPESGVEVKGESVLGRQVDVVGGAEDAVSAASLQAESSWATQPESKLPFNAASSPPASINPLFHSFANTPTSSTYPPSSGPSTDPLPSPDSHTTPAPHLLPSIPPASETTPTSLPPTSSTFPLDPPVTVPASSLPLYPPGTILWILPGILQPKSDTPCHEDPSTNSQLACSSTAIATSGSASSSTTRATASVAAISGTTIASTSAGALSSTTMPAAPGGTSSGTTIATASAHANSSTTATAAPAGATHGFTAATASNSATVSATTSAIASTAASSSSTTVTTSAGVSSAAAAFSPASCLLTMKLPLPSTAAPASASTMSRLSFSTPSWLRIGNTAFMSGTSTATSATAKSMSGTSTAAAPSSCEADPLAADSQVRLDYLQDYLDSPQVFGELPALPRAATPLNPAEPVAATTLNPTVPSSATTLNPTAPSSATPQTLTTPQTHPRQPATFVQIPACNSPSSLEQPAPSRGSSLLHVHGLMVLAAQRLKHRVAQQVRGNDAAAAAAAANPTLGTAGVASQMLDTAGAANPTLDSTGDAGDMLDNAAVENPAVSAATVTSEANATSMAMDPSNATKPFGKAMREQVQSLDIAAHSNRNPAVVADVGEASGTPHREPHSTSLSAAQAAAGSGFPVVNPSNVPVDKSELEVSETCSPRNVTRALVKESMASNVAHADKKGGPTVLHTGTAGHTTVVGRVGDPISTHVETAGHVIALHLDCAGEVTVGGVDSTGSVTVATLDTKEDIARTCIDMVEGVTSSSECTAGDVASSSAYGQDKLQQQPAFLPPPQQQQAVSPQQVESERSLQGQPVQDERPLQGQPVKDERPLQGQPVKDERPLQGQPVENERPQNGHMYLYREVSGSIPAPQAPAAALQLDSQPASIAPPLAPRLPNQTTQVASRAAQPGVHPHPCEPTTTPAPKPARSPSAPRPSHHQLTSSPSVRHAADTGPELAIVSKDNSPESAIGIEDTGFDSTIVREVERPTEAPPAPAWWAVSTVTAVPVTGGGQGTTATQVIVPMPSTDVATASVCDSASNKHAVPTSHTSPTHAASTNNTSSPRAAHNNDSLLPDAAHTIHSSPSYTCAAAPPTAGERIATNGKVWAIPVASPPSPPPSCDTLTNAHLVEGSEARAVLEVTPLPVDATMPLPTQRVPSNAHPLSLGAMDALSGAPTKQAEPGMPPKQHASMQAGDPGAADKCTQLPLEQHVGPAVSTDEEAPSTGQASMPARAASWAADSVVAATSASLKSRSATSALLESHLAASALLESHSATAASCTSFPGQAAHHLTSTPLAGPSSMPHNMLSVPLAASTASTQSSAQLSDPNHLLPFPPVLTNRSDPTPLPSKPPALTDLPTRNPLPSKSSALTDQLDSTPLTPPPRALTEPTNSLPTATKPTTQASTWNHSSVTAIPTRSLPAPTPTPVSSESPLSSAARLAGLFSSKLQQQQQQMSEQLQRLKSNLGVMLQPSAPPPPPVLVVADRVCFEDLYVTSGGLTDHLPDVYLEALQKAMQELVGADEGEEPSS